MKIKFPATVISVLTGGTLFLVSNIFELDLFEKIIKMLSTFEKYEIDEMIIPLIIIITSIFIDFKRKADKAKIENEKLKIYKAMIFTTHHILNNFLNQMQLFKMTAEDTPDFPVDVINLFDTTIEEASSQINALSTISQIDEDTIQESVKP